MPLIFEKTFDITIPIKGIKQSQTHIILNSLGNEKKLKKKIVDDNHLKNYDYNFVPILIFKKTVEKYFVQFCLSNEDNSYQIVPYKSELNYFIHKLKKKNIYNFTTQTDFLKFIKKYENKIPQIYITKNVDVNNKCKYDSVFNIVSDRTYKMTNICKNNSEIGEEDIKNIFVAIQKLLKYKNQYKIIKIIDKHFNEIKKKYDSNKKINNNNDDNNDDDINNDDDDDDDDDDENDDDDDENNNNNDNNINIDINNDNDNINNNDDSDDDNNGDDDNADNDDNNDDDDDDDDDDDNNMVDDDDDDDNNMVDDDNNNMIDDNDDNDNDEDDDGDDYDIYNIKNIEKTKKDHSSLISLAEIDFKKEFINPNSANDKKIQVMNKALKSTLNGIQQDQNTKTKTKSINNDNNNNNKKKTDMVDNNNNNNNKILKRKIKLNEKKESPPKKRKLITNTNNIIKNNNNNNTTTTTTTTTTTNIRINNNEKKNIKNFQDNIIYKFYNDSLKKVFVPSHTAYKKSNEKIYRIMHDELKIELSFNDFLDINYWNNLDFSELFVPIYYSLITGKYNDHYNFKTKNQFIENNPENKIMKIVPDHTGLFDCSKIIEKKNKEEKKFIDLVNIELQYFNLENIDKKKLHEFRNQKMNITKFFLIWLNVINEIVSKNYINMTLLNEKFNKIGLFDFKNSELSRIYEKKRDFFILL